MTPPKAKTKVGEPPREKVAKEAEYKGRYARTDWSQVKLLRVEVFYAAGRLSVERAVRFHDTCAQVYRFK